MYGVSTNHGYIINHLLVNNSNKGGCVSKCYLHISVNGMLRDWVAGVPPLQRTYDRTQDLCPLWFLGEGRAQKCKQKKNSKNFSNFGAYKNKIR